jgi:hypothetical protein
MNLSERSPGLTTFRKCQLCGYISDEITDFWMWQECDEKDVPKPGVFVITCRQDLCRKEIDDHPVLYMLHQWATGEPGHFMLLCGECDFRSVFDCTHPHLKKNGGEGLAVVLDWPMGRGTTICYSDRCVRPRPIGVKCEGLVVGGDLQPRTYVEEP